ncbi:GspH/FimT family pseudopilin [Piscinibacter sakaiensis]|uniref:GspH/FimT family pseudopilin n=1 Tax=Piscinibacter sakaiensis TaxID=1547922 RepID=UPI003AAEF90D
MRISNRQRGVSMIEVLTVVSIIGILLVAVAPEITTQLRNAQIRNAADSMIAGLQRARSEAIRRNQDVRFSLVSDLSDDCVLSSSAGSWVVSLDDPVGNCATPASESTAPRILAVHSAADGNVMAKVVATQADGATPAREIIFNGFGRPKDATQLGRIVMSSANSPTEYRSYRVDVSPVGGVRMCDTKVSQTSEDPRRCPPA